MTKKPRPHILDGVSLPAPVHLGPPLPTWVDVDIEEIYIHVDFYDAWSSLCHTLAAHLVTKNIPRVRIPDEQYFYDEQTGHLYISTTIGGDPVSFPIQQDWWKWDEDLTSPSLTQKGKPLH